MTSWRPQQDWSARLAGGALPVAPEGVPASAANHREGVTLASEGPEGVIQTDSPGQEG